MSKLQEARRKLRGELEAPPALRQLGSGWISGVLGLVLGLAGFSLVLALRMPGTFSIPETQALYENPWFRVGLHVLLFAAFGFSALSLALRPGKILGTCGVSLTLDRLFGTYHLPREKWPEGYGIGGHPVPLGYLKQFKYPFQREKAEE